MEPVQIETRINIDNSPNIVVNQIACNSLHSSRTLDSDTSDKDLVRFLRLDIFQKMVRRSLWHNW
jgi:hypothetical protein